jgi:hypothetical protein
MTQTSQYLTVDAVPCTRCHTHFAPATTGLCAVCEVTAVLTAMRAAFQLYARHRPNCLALEFAAGPCSCGLEKVRHDLGLDDDPSRSVDPRARDGAR